MVPSVMTTDDEYAAIGIDPWPSGTATDVSSEADERWTKAHEALRRAAGDPVELKVGLAVMRLRLYWGWSQKDLELLSGVDQTTLSRLERGRQAGLSIRRLFAILGALRVGEVQFLPRTPLVPPTPLELLLHGDPWKRAIAEADRRVNRRRSA